MAWFKKLNWVNGAAPSRNATNLNSRDDGIEDAIYGSGLPIINSVNWQYTYDSQGRVSTSIAKDGSDVTRVQKDYTYDTQGRISSRRTRTYSESSILLRDFTDPYVYNTSGQIEKYGNRSVV